MLPLPSGRGTFAASLVVLALSLLLPPVSAHAEAPAPPPVAGQPPVAGPPPVAGELSQGSAPAATDTPNPRPIARVVIQSPTEVVPSLSCPATAKARRTAHPGILLACQEQHFHATKAPGLLALARRLEAAGLFDEAGHRWRTLGARGGGDRGLEASRRANAIAELGLAQDVAVKGKARRGKARLLSAMQTFERQQKAMGWLVPASVRQSAVLLARAARLRRQAKRWKAAIHGGPSWFKGRLSKPGRRAPSVLVERCLGGVGYDLVRDAKRLPSGHVLAVGEATAADGDTQLRTWVLDPTGRTQRRADFGAGGPDRPRALALDGAAGAWVVGETDAAPGSDALFVRLDLQGRVRGHDERDGGGVDRAVGVVRLAAGRALAIAEADVTGASDIWLLQLDARGKITADTHVRRKGKQRVHAYHFSQGRRSGKLWIGGRSGTAGFLEAFDTSGASKGAVKAKLPGPVLALAPARRGALWVVGRRSNGKGWFGILSRKGRFKLQKRFKPSLPKGARVTLLPGRRGATMWVRAPGRLGTAWLAKLGQRGRLKGKATLSSGGATGVNVVLPAGKRALVALGAAEGCGRGLLDGWFAHLSAR